MKLNSSKDTAAINLMLHIARSNDAGPDSSLRLFEYAYAKSKKAGYADGTVASLCGIGFIYIDSGYYERSLDYFSQALTYAAASGNKRDSAICINDLGLTYFYLGNYSKASENYFFALQALKRVENDHSGTEVNILNNISNLYVRLGQQEKARYYIGYAEDIIRKKNDPYHLAMTLNNKAFLYDVVKDQDSVRKIFFEILDIADKNNYTDLRISANINIGECYAGIGQYQMAIPYYQKAMRIAGSSHNTLYITAAYSLGKALVHLGKYNEAETILRAAIVNSTDAHLYDNLVAGYTILSELYRLSGQYKKAIGILDTLALVKDSLTGIEKVKAINQLEIKYKTTEKDKQIAEGKLLILQQENKIAGRNRWIEAIVIGICSIIVLFTILFRNRQKMLMERIKSIERKKEIEVLKAMLDGEEKERSRIAKELHDGIGGMLSATMIRFTTANQQAPNDNSSKQEVLNLLEEMGDEIRKTAHNLVPGVLLKQTLPEALCSYCNNVQDGNTLQIEFQSHGDFGQLGPDVKLNVYRIVQELLNNIAQHAKASYALVQLILHEALLTITVEDNGTGFDVNEVKNGIGLYNLRSRVLVLNGSYTIESDVGKGTSVYIEFDLRNSKSKDHED